MTSFKDFWEDGNSSTDSASLPADSASPATLCVTLTSGIQSILGTSSTQAIAAPIGFFGSNNTQAKVDEFSQQVTDYVTSDEVISSLSEKIGEPQTKETEEEFVERASNILRGILRKKFNS